MTRPKLWKDMSEAERRAWTGAVAQPDGAQQTVPMRAVLASGAAEIPDLTPPYTEVRSGLFSWSAPDGLATEVTVFVGPFITGTATRSSRIAASTPSRELVMILELGVGNAAVTVACDLKSGAMRLPPVSYVKAGVRCRQGPVPGAVQNLQVSAALVAGTADTDGPQYTQWNVPNGLVTAPLGATDVRLVNPGRIVNLGATQNVIMEPTAVTPLVSPPYAPVEVTEQSGTVWNFTAEPAAALPGIIVWGLL